MTFANVFLLASAILVSVSNGGGTSTDAPVPVYSVQSVVCNTTNVPLGTNNMTILQTTIHGSIDDVTPPQDYPLMSAFVTRMPVSTNYIRLYFNFSWTNTN